MQYTSEQIQQVTDWLENQAEDDVNFDGHLSTFVTLKSIVIHKENPESMFKYLMDWGLENLEHEGELD